MGYSARLILALLISVALRASAEHYDLYVPCCDRWDVRCWEFAVGGDGTVSPGAPSKFLHGKGPRRPNPLIFHTEYPGDGKFLMVVDTVSIRAELEVWRDEVLVWEANLPAGPGVGPWKKTEYLPQYGIYQSTYHREVAIEVPAGRHTIKIENHGPDWVSIDHVVFVGYLRRPISLEYGEWQGYRLTLAELPLRIEAYRGETEKFAAQWKPGDANREVLPTLRLQLENLQELATAHRPVDFDLMRTEKELREILSLIKEGKDYFAHKRGRVKRAYLSPIDDTCQPYDAMIPDRYDPKRSYALLVSLHGYQPEIQKYQNFLRADADPGLDELGLIKVAVYGRRNRYYLGAAEADVLEVIDDMLRHYSIDEDRVYLEGASMGGYGTWKIGLGHPDRFAAICALCGSVDLAAKDAAHYPKSSSARLLESLSPFACAPNAKNLPVKIYHGAVDPIISVEHSRKISAALKKLGYRHEYTEYPDTAHDVWVPAAADPGHLPYLLQFRNDHWPDSIAHRTFYLRTGKSYWLAITAKDTWEEFAAVDAKIEGQGRVRIETNNVSELELNLGHPKFTRGAALQIAIDEEVLTLTAHQKHILSSRAGKWEKGALPRAGIGKRKYLEGPWLDGETRPFAIVYGTLKPQQRDRLQRIGEALQAHYRSFDLRPCLISDVDAAAGNYAGRYHLYLLGTPEENACLGEIVSRMPLTFAGDSFGFAGNTYRLAESGLRMIYPNPAAPHNYVSVDVFPHCPMDFGAIMGQLLPDYLVYTWRDGRLTVEKEGFFDAHWQFSR